MVFRPPLFNVIPDDEYDDDTEINRFTIKTTDGSSDLISIPGVFKFCASTGDFKQPLDISPAKTVQNGHVSYTWLQVPVAIRGDGYPDLGKVPNFDTIQGLLGSLNQFTLDEYAPGTLLFATWSSKLTLPQTATSNSYYWDITYNFSVRDYGESPYAGSSGIPAGEHIGWNYAWSGYTGSWDLYSTTGDPSGGTMYNYADFGPLFQV
ncbi:hypothetical protein FRUB_00328 [Fimbriiglobus ruber]|uniref:Uncharacterized protein n=1 Tax=Fimbriiglobus ruber TaxID=1908690 RepID=A0A225EB76_9BACT|nr:hypothetical protein FRUB_00328 [Fimbriiglobus ruber]